MINIVILSNTANEEIRKMTQECIDSIHSTASANVVVVETNPTALDFNGADKILINEAFSFNRFLNFGINYSLDKWPDSEYTVLANNDLLFMPQWFERMEPHFWVFDCLSPKSPDWPFQQQFEFGVHEGWGIGHEFSGWCLVFKTSSLKKLLPLDEQFEFWCADNDMVEIMKSLNMRQALIADSHVKHLVNKSHSLIKDLNYYTNEMINKFNRKWQR